MRSSVLLSTGPGFTLDAVTCVDDHRDWSPTEVGSRYRMVLVRRGTFRRMADGRPAVADPTMAYLGVPGEEERFAHPAGGDVCTSLSLTPELWGTLAGEETRPARSTVYVDARLDLAHRRVLAAAREGDAGFALTESLLPLVAAALAEAATRAGTAAIADAAREAIAADHPAAGGLLSLAEFLAVSPYQLSRAFTRELGVSLTHYRNRVRVGRALDRLENGEPSLAALAADLGFADQAHLTRTIRRHVDHTPTALRRLLASRDP
ncbi:helix-turn-helix domain-containing protein [Nonomuraea basaltis]|uniref:helix-turn-helix domain-containing protein n=1 Tax=Nonomuraea basaltis TaxID=2495887 RepID=UPI00197E7C4E|nr:AraC family transcriptional regulator [Nonomuraea basaltis]